MFLQIKKCKEGIQFSACIQPRASQNKIVGLHNNALKIRLTAPPVEGAANRMCVKFLAKYLGISPSRVSVAAGAACKNKTIKIEAMSPETFLQKLKSVCLDITGGPRDS